jgi:hypothetical protein
MLCLYASDYGPANPAFDPLADGGRLIQGFEAHVSELAKAQNLSQIEAMERQLQRGQDILWCEQGYSWVYDRNVEYFFAAFAILVILPYIVLRLFPRLRNDVARLRRFSWDRRDADVAASALIRQISPGEP